LEPVLSCPHPDDAGNAILSRRLRFRTKLAGGDLIAFARLVESQGELAAQFEGALDSLRSLLASRVIEQLRGIRFLRSSLGGLDCPSALYRRTPLTRACLGGNSPFVAGHRDRLYRRLGCL